MCLDRPLSQARHYTNRKGVRAKETKSHHENRFMVVTPSSERRTASDQLGESAGRPINRFVYLRGRKFLPRRHHLECRADDRPRARVYTLFASRFSFIRANASCSGSCAAIVFPISAIAVSWPGPRDSVGCSSDTFLRLSQERRRHWRCDAPGGQRDRRPKSRPRPIQSNTNF